MIDLLSIAPFYLQFMIPGIDLRILADVALAAYFKIVNLQLSADGLIFGY